MVGIVNTSGGVKIAIGSENSSPQTATLVSLEADSYMDVGDVEDGGAFGDESKVIEFTALADARVKKFKGPRDAGTMTVTVGDDPTDEGQIAMEAAQTTKFDYNFRVTLNDQVTLHGTPSVFYFCAKVMSERLTVGNVMNVVKRAFQLGINTAIFGVLPT